MKKIMAFGAVLILAVSAEANAGSGDFLVNGKLGVGTSSPATAVNLSATETGADTAVTMGSENRYGIGFNGQGAGHFNVFAHQTAASIGLGFDTGSYGTFSEKLTVQSNGKVGIGNSAPVTFLSLPDTASGNTTAVTMGTEGRYGIGFNGDTAGYFNIFAHQWAHSINLGFDTGSYGSTFNRVMVVHRDGRVGINISEPALTLHVNGSAGGITGWYNLSDESLKKNIVQIEGALSKVKQLRGVNFEWDEEKFVWDVDPEGKKKASLPKGKRIGLIAQEVMAVCPEAVSSLDDGRYAICSADLIGLLVEAIKEQQKIIEAQDTMIKSLDQRVTLLENN